MLLRLSADISNLCCEQCRLGNECCGKACCEIVCCVLLLYGLRGSQSAQYVPLEERKVEPSRCTDGCCADDQDASSGDDDDDKSESDTGKDGPTAKRIFDVTGITCADCALALEKKLKRRKGVISVCVSAMTGRTEVTYDEVRVDEAALKQAIEELGYAAEVVPPQGTTRLALRIIKENDGSDLTRDDLAAKVGAQPGVAAAKVHKGVLTIDYYHEEVGARALVSLVEGLGFDASLEANGGAPPRGSKKNRGEVRRFKWLFWFSALLAVPVFLIAFIFPQINATDDFFDQWTVPGLSVGVLVEWILTTPIQLGAAIPFYLSAYKALRYNFKANIDTLVVMSTLTAYVYSVVSTIVSMADPSYEGKFTPLPSQFFFFFFFFLLPLSDQHKLTKI
jgi:Cu+-exporting ATPase